MSESSPPPASAGPGSFVLTLDTELVWGSFDHTSTADFDRAYPDVRGTVEAILRVLERHEVPATWAVVGHLFLDSCERDSDGIAHPELAETRQSHWDGQWYSADPCTDRSRDPLWYGTDVLEMIEGATTGQEIACHSFGHAAFGDAAFTREAAAADLKACIELARRRGIELKSFVFPRNAEGHHDVIRDAGFIAFRGADPATADHLPRSLRRARNLVTHAYGTAPSVVRPTERLPGLWDIKASMLFMSKRGLRRMITRSARLRQARSGLQVASRTGGVFHLWTHPFNLSSNRDDLVASLEDIIIEAARMRDRGEISIATMAQIAEACASGGGAEIAAPDAAPDHVSGRATGSPA